MATLEDKILGEKLHNYCSSSEESDGDNSDSEDSNKKNADVGAKSELPEPNKWEGNSIYFLFYARLFFNYYKQKQS